MIQPVCHAPQLENTIYLDLLGELKLSLANYLFTLEYQSC